MKHVNHDGHYFIRQVRDKIVDALLSIDVPADKQFDMVAPNVASLSGKAEELSTSSAGKITKRLVNMAAILSSSSDSERITSMAENLFTAMGSVMSSITFNADPYKNQPSENVSHTDENTWTSEKVIKDNLIFSCTHLPENIL